jgi:predicted phage terminase large subunit-like protein
MVPDLLSIGGAGGNFFVMDVLRERMEWPRLLAAAKMQYERFHPRLVLVEERASGISLIQALMGETMLPVLPVKAETSKLARTTSISSLIESGRLWVPEGFSWADAFLQECAMFPSGAHDDQVDALIHALRYFMLREGETLVLTYEVPVSISPDLDQFDCG